MSDQSRVLASAAQCLEVLFEELRDPQVSEVHIVPGDRGAMVECRGAAGVQRRHTLPALLVPVVIAKLKKIAYLDVAERTRPQRGRVRMLDFHGAPAEFEIAIAPTAQGETASLRRA